ncbi:MAG: extracellular solute-binding protein, partial [Candidatus Devosia euplotis]|nr:extracellular solute-binding protein [Candidatus Devosia euplotis]
MRTLIAAGPILATVLSPAFAQEGRLVLYISQPNTDAQATADAFMAKYPGISVEWVRDGTPVIMAKFHAELAAGTTQADVLLIADAVTMEDLKTEGLLMNFPQASTDGIDPALID